MTVPDRIDVRRTRAVVPGVGRGDAELVVSNGDRDFDYETAVELAATIILARQRRDTRELPGDRGPLPAPPGAPPEEQARPPLPEAVLTAMAGPRPATRQGAVPQLYRLAFDTNPAVRLAASQALERLAEDESGAVMIAARRALAAFRPTPPPPPPPSVNPPPAIAGGPVRQPFRHSRFWYWVAAAAVLGAGALLLLGVDGLHQRGRGAAAGAHPRPGRGSL